MTVPQAVGEFLRSEATATIALVGTRTYWALGPQNVTMPFIVFRQAGSQRIAIHMNGASDPRETIIEILCCAESQSAAWALEQAVLSDMDNFTGLMPSGGDLKIKRCFQSTSSDFISPELAEAGIYSVSTEYRIMT